MSTDGSQRSNRIDLHAESTEHDRRAFADIEREVMHDDPAFVRRLRRLERGDDAHTATIFGLLVASVVLLALGLATVSWVAWIAGASVFIGVFAFDDRYRRRDGRLQDDRQ